MSSLYEVGSVLRQRRGKVMKRVSHNHPSLRNVPCYDCGDDYTKDGFVDQIDGAYFCLACANERGATLSVSERKTAVGHRRWADYDERKRKANKRNLIVAFTLMLLAGRFGTDAHAFGAATLVVVAMIPYMRPQ